MAAMDECVVSVLRFPGVLFFAKRAELSDVSTCLSLLISHHPVNNDGNCITSLIRCFNFSCLDTFQTSDAANQSLTVLSIIVCNIYAKYYLCA